VKNWVYINRVFRRAFTKKVLVVGASSAGKSTLVRRLARSLNAPFSEEYARKYEEKMNISDDELTVPDYISFFEGQDRDNNHEVESPSNQGIVFFDTDAITTKIYASRYLPKDSRRLWEPVADVYIQKEQPDLILVVPPQRFVDDGFRSLDWADDRMQFHNDMMKELESHGFMDRVVVLDDVGTDDDSDGYYARYLHAMQAVTERMDVKMMALDA
jgi:NadR type nicotinamide-nucleotide adenylyltransferase